MTTILLLFGGESSEHEVSIVSARNVLAAINKERYDVQLSYIDRQGRWWLIDTFEDHEAALERGVPLSPLLGEGQFLAGTDTSLHVDVLFPILHGKNGEDGSIAALGQLLHLPVVGCDMTSGAVCMDKRMTKELALQHDVSVVPYIVHRTGDPAPQMSELETALGAPLFVKPTRAGSSVGVSKVRNQAELDQALAQAHEHDAVALIEQGIEARELEVAVLGNPPHHQASGVGEIVADGEFYSYDSKYASSSTSQAIIPADLPEGIAETITSQALVIYQLLECRGLARVDFFYEDATGNLYFNEINTIPGFTNISMYPKLWQAAGIAYPELIEKLLDSAKN